MLALLFKDQKTRQLIVASRFLHKIYHRDALLLHSIHKHIKTLISYRHFCIVIERNYGQSYSYNCCGGYGEI